MAKPNLLIVGAGGVGQVTANKAVQFRKDFGTITLAARSADKLNRIAGPAASRSLRCARSMPAISMR